MKLIDGSAPLTPVDILQLALTLLCVIVAFSRPRLGERWWVRIENTIRGVSRRRWLCAAIASLVPVCLRLLLVPVWAPPTAYVHDEFAYLLQADTFVSGRVTNPSPPMPAHFASVYTLVTPTYTSEYQPAQALALGLGQRLTGSAWAGAVISMGLLCALLYWALLAWLPSTWAFIGAALFGIEIGVLTYWMNSYWGGCVPAIGGTLVFGGLVRLRERPRVLDGVLTAVGLVILSNSRPLEGALLCIVTVGAALYWLLGADNTYRRKFLRRAVAPAVIVFGTAIMLMGYYNYRVTGQIAKFPYLLYRQLYGTPQGFIWQKPVRAGSAMPVDMEAVYLGQLRQHEQYRSVAGFLRGTARKLRRMWEFYVGVPLLLTLVFVPSIWRGRNMGLALAGIILVFLDNLTFFEYYPHYSAAIAVLLFLVIVQCLRRMRHSGQAGLFLSRSLPVICGVGLLVPACGRVLEFGFGVNSPSLIKLWHNEFWYPSSRAIIQKQLENQPGEDLVFVRYKPMAAHIPGDTSLELQRQREDTGWIYNLANLRSAKVLWARDLNPTSNRQLLKYFPGRRLWLVKADERPICLRPYGRRDPLE